MNLLGIIRVSTEEQAGADRAGIDRQRAGIERIAASMACSVEILDPVTDVSGSDLAKTEVWKHVVSRLQKDPDLYLAVDSVDRLIRADSFDFRVLETLQKIRPQVYTSQGIYDLSQPSGVLVAGLLGLAGGFEKAQIKARLTGAKEAKRRRGEFPSGENCLPTGVHFCQKSKKWSYTPEAEKVKEAYRLFVDENLSYAAIARRVGSSRVTVRLWVQNPIYRGIMAYTHTQTGEPYPTQNGKQPAKRKVKRDKPLEVRVFHPDQQLVADGVWEMAQRKAKNITITNRKQREDGSDVIYYSGFLYSAIDRLAYLPDSKPKQVDPDYINKHILYGRNIQGRLPRYSCRCLGRKTDPGAPREKCGIPLFRCSEVNEALDTLLEKLTRTDLYSKALASLDRQNNREVDPKVYKKQLADFVKKERRLVDLELDGRISRQTYNEKWDALQEQKSRIEEVLQKAEEAPAPVDEKALKDYFDSLRFSKKWTPPKKREWLQKHVGMILLKPEGVASVSLWLPHNADSNPTFSLDGPFSWVELLGYDISSVKNRIASQGFKTLSGVAESLGIKKHQLSYLLQSGQVPIPQKTHGRQRLWSASEIAQTRQILQDLGKIPNP